jgi:hypothetical protein
MGCKTIPEQLANALGKEDVANSDQLPIVQNNTLYRTTLADIINSLGVTGTLNSVGGNNATPILQGSAPDYELRGVQGGAGITVQVSPLNAVTIAMQVSNSGNSDAGAAIIPSNTSDTIQFRRIKAGNGIEVTQESNSITIDNTQVAVSNSTTIVNELSDFPNPVSGVITLANDTDYLISNSISTTNRFILSQNTVVRSVDNRINTLTYTGTGTMFTCGQGAQVIKEISISCPNGQFIDTTGNSTGGLTLRWVRFTEVKDFGVLAKPLVDIYDILVELHTGDGFEFSPSITNRRLVIENWTCLNTTSDTNVFLDLSTAEFSAFSIINLQFLSTVIGQTLLKGLAGGDNMALETIGYVSFVTVKGGMVALDTISNSDAGWDFDAVNILADTQPHAIVSLNAQATTTITATSTPVAVNGNFSPAGVQLYETNANGRITYKGKRDRFVRIDATLSFQQNGGNGRILTAAIAVNNTVLAASTVQREVDNGEAGAVALTWGVDLSTDDFIEIFVGNNSTTDNIQVNQLILRTS